MSTTEISTLPPPEVIEELDFEVILQEIISYFKAQMPDHPVDLESEPVMKIFEVFAWREMFIRGRINDVVFSNLISLATGTDLDHLAVFVGLTRLPGESDDRFRVRILLRYAALAGNGTAEHYKACALEASLDVVDVVVRQPYPGAVDVIVWLSSSANAADVLQLVYASLNAPDRKMLGVTVNAYVAQPYYVDFKARIWRETSAPLNIAKQIEQSLLAKLNAYAQLGKSISESWMTSQLQTYQGVAKVELVSPNADIKVESDSCVVFRSVEIIDMGAAL